MDGGDEINVENNFKTSTLAKPVKVLRRYKKKKKNNSKDLLISSPVFKIGTES